MTITSYNTPMSQSHDTSWNKSSRWYHKAVGESGHYYHTHVVMPAVKRHLHLRDDSVVIDLGCGQGVLARSIPEAVKYIGIDSAPKLVQEAKSMNKSLDHRFLVSDATKPLPLKEKATHVAIILALQNMKNIDGVMQNAESLLQTNGSLIIVLNHPSFRVPRQSGWTINPDNKIQVRWISRYKSEIEVPITMHPGKRQSELTWSYHRPLETYISSLNKHHFAVTHIEELVSDKESEGKAAKMENRSRVEIPMFMLIKAIKTDKLYYL